ncbi:glycosyltransferase family 4 protein [Gramella aestuarii]|uniref:Glycosyltransferase family 4 protein n=1 Tax=Christiangramia aestuarii TaxID=1028746 RepID=A0A7M3SXH0_9FLAO|nr:glycosyltransferase family 4 protein [Christiangramia aestuarii]
MVKPTKILHLSAAKSWGGGENHLLNLCLELPEVEHFVLCKKGSEPVERFSSYKLNIFAAPLLIKPDLRYVLKLIRICKREGINLIHIHDSTALTLAVMATKLSALPPFVLSKKTSFPIKDRGRTLYKYNHKNIQKILCVSNETRRVTFESVKDKNKLTTIYHGTRPSNPGNNPCSLRERFNIPKDSILVGTVANHIRAKDLGTWVATIDRVVNRLGMKNFYFIEIGKITERTADYNRQIREKNLQDYCMFTGFLPEASELISQFDISFMTSQSEGIPQFIYESFYNRVPVVSTNVGGIPEIITDGENGMLSNPFEAARLADKLIALSQDKVLQKKFTERSYKKLIENFTSTEMARQTLAEYKKVLYGENRSGS